MAQFQSTSVTGSLTVTGQVVAQTLNVQQVTSSIVYSSGSNIFGNTLGNTQQFTGSLQVSGSSHYVLGNVGVGSISPVKTLEVRGTLAISNNASSYWYMDRDDSDGRFKILTDTDNERFSISTAGAATFRGTGDDILTIGNRTASQNAYLQLNAGSTSNAYINSIGSGSLILGANGAASNHLSISSTGAATFSNVVGINRTPTSGYKLDIQGNEGIRIIDNDVLRSIIITPPNSGASGTISTASGQGISFQSTNASGNLKFETAGVERIRVTTDGLTFNGDTAAANALDDYEEGTWTPTINFGGTSGSSTGVTYTSQAGRYTKIGRAVCYVGEIVLSSKGSGTGIMRITGWPFTNGTERASLSFGNVTSLSHTGFLQSYIEGASTYTNTYSTSDAGTQTQIADTNASNTTHIQFSVVSQV